MNLMIPSSFFLFVYLFTSSVSAQQRYSGNSVLNCNNNDDSGPSPSFLYTCNINKSSCQAFVIFKSSPPYDSVTSISTLLSSDPSQIAAINNVSMFSNFDVEKEVIVPVNCFCSGKYYQANSSYEIPTSSSTYYTIALETYQGLSTCDSLKAQNVYDEKALVPGVRLRVPLRCACPTGNQIARGMKYLLTYSISLGDDLTSISERFNLTRKELTEANGFSEDNPTIFPLTTILIPLPVKPSSSQAITHPAPEIFSSPYIPRPVPALRPSVFSGCLGPKKN